MRVVATCTIVLASGFFGQAMPATLLALSLPRRQLKVPAHAGQPVPRYSTVLLLVRSHVLKVSVPPRGSASLMVMRKTSRAPGENVW